MESKYHYFKRDISWLSFNYRVLLEADDDSLPLYERINFISIYSSNLEEFYKIRVAEHKAIASGGQSDDMTQEEARHLIHQITALCVIKLDACMVSRPSVPPPAPTRLLPATISSDHIR